MWPSHNVLNWHTSNCVAVHKMQLVLSVYAKIGFSIYFARSAKPKCSLLGLVGQLSKFNWLNQTGFMSFLFHYSIY